MKQHDTGMVQIQLVTVEGCPEAICANCTLAETALRQALGLAGINLPPHLKTSSGEYHLDDGRAVETVHLQCGEAGSHGLDPAKAPYLLIDGEVILEGAETDAEVLAQAVLRALFPHGLADLRP